MTVINRCGLAAAPIRLTGAVLYSYLILLKSLISVDLEKQVHESLEISDLVDVIYNGPVSVEVVSALGSTDYYAP